MGPHVAANSSSPSRPTTVLGDWYCTALNHRHRRLVLRLAERSLLPVIVPAKDFTTFPAAWQGLLSGCWKC